MGLIRSPIQRVPSLFPGIRRPGRGVDHPPPSSAEVKERVLLYLYFSGFGGLQVACWSLVPNLTGSNTAEAVGLFSGRKKNSQHAFLRKGSKAVCPMSYIYGM